MTKILVTGATGFLGRFIVDRLTRENFLVKALIRNPKHHAIQDWNKNVEVVKGDILDVPSLEDAIEGVTHVVHAAATVAFLKKDHSLMKRVNEQGTANVVNICLEKGIKRLVHVSSVAALGRTENAGLITEKNKWQDSPLNTIYAKTKYLAEKQVYRGIEEGLYAVICNPSMIMGYGDWHSGTPKLFTMIYKGYPFYPKGSNGFVGAVDVAEAIRLLLDAPDVCGERFILSQANLTYKKLFDLIAFALNKKAPFIRISPILSKCYGSVSEFFGNLFGHEPLVSYETAMTSSQHFAYDGSKITQQLEFHYTSIETIIRETAALFLQENSPAKR